MVAAMGKQESTAELAVVQMMLRDHHGHCIPLTQLGSRTMLRFPRILSKLRTAFDRLLQRAAREVYIESRERKLQRRPTAIGRMQRMVMLKATALRVTPTAEGAAAAEAKGSGAALDGIWLSPKRLELLNIALRDLGLDVDRRLTLSAAHVSRVNRHHTLVRRMFEPTRAGVVAASAAERAEAERALASLSAETEADQRRTGTLTSFFLAELGVQAGGVLTEDVFKMLVSRIAADQRDWRDSTGTFGTKVNHCIGFYQVRATVHACGSHSDCAAGGAVLCAPPSSSVGVVHSS